MLDILVFTVAPCLIVGAIVYTFMKIENNNERINGFNDGLDAADLIRNTKRNINTMMADIDQMLVVKEPAIDDALSDTDEEIKKKKAANAKPKKKTTKKSKKPTPARQTKKK